MEGRVIKDAVRRTLQEREKALTYLVDAIREYRTLADQPLTHQSFSAVRPRSSILEDAALATLSAKLRSRRFKPNEPSSLLYMPD
jgi:hypothetical protein